MALLENLSFLSFSKLKEEADEPTNQCASHRGSAQAQEPTRLLWVDQQEEDPCICSPWQGQRGQAFRLKRPTFEKRNTKNIRFCLPFILRFKESSHALDQWVKTESSAFPTLNASVPYQTRWLQTIVPTIEEVGTYLSYVCYSECCSTES